MDDVRVWSEFLSFPTTPEEVSLSCANVRTVKPSLISCWSMDETLVNEKASTVLGMEKTLTKLISC